jgi:hypothetical protein
MLPETVVDAFHRIRYIRHVHEEKMYESGKILGLNRNLKAFQLPSYCYSGLFVPWWSK